MGWFNHQLGSSKISPDSQIMLSFLPFEELRRNIFKRHFNVGGFRGFPPWKRCSCCCILPPEKVALPVPLAPPRPSAAQKPTRTSPWATPSRRWRAGRSCCRSRWRRGKMGRCQEVAFFGGSKQCKFMVIWRDFPYNNAWFGLGGEEIHPFFWGGDWWFKKFRFFTSPWGNDAIWLF